MLLGASVLCLLVLLMLLADRLGARVFQGRSDRVFYRCEACDLRYPRGDIADPELRFCPHGHPVVVEHPHTAAGVVGICACLGFLSVALVLMLAGLEH